MSVLRSPLAASDSSFFDPAFSAPAVKGDIHMATLQRSRLGLLLVSLVTGWIGCGSPENGSSGMVGRPDAPAGRPLAPDAGVVVDAPAPPSPDAPEMPDAAPDAAVPQLAGGNVPDPWRAYLVGNPEGGGSADEANGVFTVKGSGRDIYDTLGFTFVAQPLSGDGEIIAQVTGLTGDNISPLAKAGVLVMAESGLTDPATFWAGTFVTPRSGAAGQYRGETGMAASAGAGVEVVPGWVRLAKVGQEVTSYYSPDGSLWIRFGSTTLPPLEKPLIGLAVSAHDDAAGMQLATATFSSVSINRYPAGQGPDAGQPGPGDGGVPGNDGPLPTGTLPAPWAFSDLGMTLPGSAAFSGGTFQVVGGGRDIWQRADNGAFVYQRISGDAEIRADLLGVQGANQHSKAGLMFRSSLDLDDQHAMWLVKPNDPPAGVPIGLSFQWRAMRNTNARAQDQRFLFAPQTMRLVRKGSIIEASLLLPENRWFLVSRQVVEFPEAIYVGLAVTAHDQNLLATGVFRNVVVVGQAAPPLPDAGMGSDAPAADAGTRD
jgi:hypothetical protein